MNNKILVILSILLVAVCINAVSATGTFYLDPQHGSSALGTDVIVNLNFTTDAGFKSCNADLTIDSTIVNITSGDTTGPGTGPAFTLESWNYKPGGAPNTYRIAFVDLQYSGGGVPAGTYCLAKLTFSPVTVGVSNLNFTGLACTDQTGTPDTCIAIDGIFSCDAVPIHDINVSTDYAPDTNGIKIKYNGTDISASENLTIGNTYRIYYKIVNEGDYNESVDVTVKVANSTWTQTVVTHRWTIKMGHYLYPSGGDSWNTSALTPGEYNIIVNASIPIDDDWSNSERIRAVTIALPQNIPPVSDPNGPYSGTEGDPIVFNGSGSYDLDGSIATYAWDLYCHTKRNRQQRSIR